MARIGVGATDMGKVRNNNEDSIAVYNKKMGVLPNLYIVADGMGGHNAGEVASRRAIDFFVEFIINRIDLSPINIMEQGVQYANDNVYQMSITKSGYLGMGTTFTACTIIDGCMYYAHVGDSRMYLVDKIEMKQISEDHTYINEMLKTGSITKEESLVHPKRNMLTRALGTEEYIVVDTGIVTNIKDFTVLMCSDGLTGLVSDEEIYKLMLKEMNSEDKARKLIELANENGGTDNVSVIIL